MNMDVSKVLVYILYNNEYIMEHNIDKIKM